jgi:2-oxoglutarate dehydrogenase E2 component (dihydrolipoamide succinyltransferase)
MGEGIEEATLVKWLKKEGDLVKVDEPLVELSTDKVDTEIPSPYEGTVKKLLANPGETIRVHASIAELVVSSSTVVEEVSEPEPKQEGPTNTKGAKVKRTKISRSNTTAAGASAYGNNSKSTPVVRKLALEYGIPLELVPGTGIGSKVTKEDLFRHMTETGGVHLSGDAGLSPKPSAPLFHLETKKDGDTETLEGVPVRREKMSKMRGLIAEHMIRSIRVSPHVTTTFEVDFTPIWNHRTESKDAFTKKHGFKPTFTHYLTYAAVQAIAKHPIVNVSVDGEDILYKDSINIGMAVALENGLIVPVLKNCQGKNFLEICSGIQNLVERARGKKLEPSDVKGGTFSITNPGLYGSLTSNPIINQPQVAILGIGTIVDRMEMDGSTPTTKKKMMVSLTFDHRVVDGEGGAKYLNTLKELIESPSWASF